MEIFYIIGKLFVIIGALCMLFRPSKLLLSVMILGISLQL